MPIDLEIPAFNIGDVVVLKSGGLSMTVAGLPGLASQVYILVWHSTDGLFQLAQLPAQALELDTGDQGEDDNTQRH